MLDAGSWYLKADPFQQIASGRVSIQDCATFAGLKVPTLREALELTARLGWRVNIEIKDSTGFACNSWIVEKTVALVRELGIANSVLISSFNHSYLKRSKASAPEIAVAALIDKPISDPIKTLTELGAIALNPNERYLERAIVRDVREAGFGVIPWTVNDPHRMDELLEWGVTGLISDYPDIALERVKFAN
jgi:glycerophosphoryl diester phosphodiesterase